MKKIFTLKTTQFRLWIFPLWIIWFYLVDFKLKKLLLAILQFTALLIEHSYSRHLYNSIEYLTSLLESTDFYVILSVLNLLYVFSKRSVFINRLAADKKQALIQRLLYLAEVHICFANGQRAT